MASPQVKRAPVYWKYFPYFNKVRGMLFIGSIQNLRMNALMLNELLEHFQVGTIYGVLPMIMLMKN
jgi:hypothetical protein